LVEKGYKQSTERVTQERISEKKGRTKKRGRKKNSVLEKDPARHNKKEGHHNTRKGRLEGLKSKDPKGEK